MNALEILQQAKNVWDLLHTVGGGAIKNEAGEKYIFVQGAAGGAIIDVAGGDSWDEILVGITGDVVQAIAMSPFGVAGVVIESSWIIAKGTGASSTSSLGDVIKDYYKTIKSDVATQYWKYEKDFYYMKAGQMLHLDYAKVLYDRNGAIFILGDQVVQSTYESEYNKYISTKQLLLASIDSTVLNVKIENTNGVLKVTLPDGTVVAEGDEDDNTISGDNKADYLYGMGGNDTLDTGSGQDTLDGGSGSDTLMGGDDYDTYLAGNGDTISDSDGSGRVSFEGNMLSGGVFNKDTGVYEGDGGSYSLSGGTLTFTNGSGTITIDNYSKSDNSLGIHLEDKDDDDDDENDPIIPETSAGHNENFSSPLVLDLNENGTTSTFIEKTQTYFDMNGDGFKERTSWAESSDGLLTLDLNNDGKVTNGSELFGNNTKLTNGTNAKDGFEALSQYDLNKDNVIDSKDSIYSHLKVWMDTNSDGISTNDELKTLQELNITSINLNATETSTSEAYNQISDTSTFTQDGQTKILLTCKHFSIQKSLHVRNEIQHKGAESDEETMVA